MDPGDAVLIDGFEPLRGEAILRTTDRTIAEVVAELLPRFASRAVEADDGDRFVSENVDDLREAGLLAAGIPAELGGMGATYRELCTMLRTLAHACDSTALAFSMHTHAIASMVWRREHLGAPVDALLRRVAAERLVVVSTAGSNWLESSGTARAVDGGYRVTARKPFASLSPIGDLLVSSAVHDDPAEGPTVLHFILPFDAAGVRVATTWRALGMRGTGSNDVIMEDAFVPESEITVRRPRGVWHPSMHVIVMVAFPLIYAVYVGVAEAARNIVVERLRRGRREEHATAVLGAVDNELTVARLALEDMIASYETHAPGPETTNRTLIGRTLVDRSARAAVELGLDALGGLGYLRDTGLERRFRDVMAGRFHPVREYAQQLYTGDLALGREPEPLR